MLFYLQLQLFFFLPGPPATYNLFFSDKTDTEFKEY